jgi:putative ABC transport system permease protein
VAAPAAYLVMARWLEGFAFHVDMVWWIFVGAGLATLFIIWMTIGYQSVKAALINPVRSLRYE